MALKFRINKLEDVSEALRGLYKKDPDGTDTFVLDAEVKDPRVDEFRDNNRKLFSENEELKKRLDALKDINPEEYRKGKELLDSIKVEEEKSLIKAGKFDEVIARRTAAAIEEHNARVRQLQGTLDSKDKELVTLRDRLAAATVDREIAAAIEKSGIKPRPGAMADILRRARDSWKFNEKGEMLAVGTDGKPRFGSSGDALTMDEYVKKDLVGGASHLFESGGGGGAGGGSSKAPGEPGKKVVDGSNPIEFGKNLEDIAAGKASVSTPTPSVG